MCIRDRVHTNLRALALEVSAQVSQNILAYALCNTYNAVSYTHLDVYKRQI